jgi:hypothetical protein
MQTDKDKPSKMLLRMVASLDIVKRSALQLLFDLERILTRLILNCIVFLKKILLNPPVEVVIKK